MTLDHQDLDQLLPLESGSHGAIVGLDIDIPMRYAECVVELADGRRTRLKDRRQLLGWTLGAERRSYYFRVGDRVIVLKTNTARRHPIRQIDCWEAFSACRALSSADLRVSELGKTVHKIVAPDGSLLFIAPRQTEIADSRKPVSSPAYPSPAMSVSLAT